MLLSHFTKKPFVLDTSFSYWQGSMASVNSSAKMMKPMGLWLSDESDYGWKKWCVNEEFKLERLTYQTDIEIDPSRILLLDSDDKIIRFHRKYSTPLLPGLEYMDVIRWPDVSKEYSGILISPYSWKLRLGSETFWYNGWDCASGCVWDLSAIKSVSKSKRIKIRKPRKHICG